MKRHRGQELIIDFFAADGGSSVRNGGGCAASGTIAGGTPALVKNRLLSFFQGIYQKHYE